MRYEVQYNPCRKVWQVWQVSAMGAEVVKVFKTEKAAQSWIKKHS